MKKIIRISLMVSVVLALLCVSVFAADAILKDTNDAEYSGATYYSTYDESGATTNVAVETATDGFYKDVEAIGFTYTDANATENAFALLVISTADEVADVKADNILYVNQYTFDGSKEIKPVAFPKSVTKSTVYVSFGSGLTKIATIDTSYVRGDVNGNGEADSSDATAIARVVAGLIKNITPTQIAAGDVNNTGELDVSDAVAILRYVAGLIKVL